MDYSDWVVPISRLRVQINDDYYKFHMTLEEVLQKYKRYDPDKVKEVLGIYSLDDEPDPSNESRNMTARMRREWTEECRRINPQAWRRKRR